MTTATVIGFALLALAVLWLLARDAWVDLGRGLSYGLESVDLATGNLGLVAVAALGLLLIGAHP